MSRSMRDKSSKRRSHLNEAPIRSSTPVALQGLQFAAPVPSTSLLSLEPLVEIDAALLPYPKG